jgi:hypothetical protein
MIFTHKLLLTEKVSVTATPVRFLGKMDDLTQRANEITTILKDIQGYYHGGLNE